MSRRRGRDSCAAGFPDQAIGLAAPDGEAEIRQHAALSPAGAIDDVEMLDAQCVGDRRRGGCFQTSNTPCRPSVARFSRNLSVNPYPASPERRPVGQSEEIAGGRTRKQRLFAPPHEKRTKLNVSSASVPQLAAWLS
jgi:hypothetical protein